MKYLKNLLAIKTPSSSALVDLALILAIIPHLAYLKFPMLVFLLSALGLLVLKKEISPGVQRGLALFGFISIIISFYTDFNFSSLNRFSIFIALINALLILAVVLQRFKKELNFYIIFAPAMLLFLSFFMHNSILMLFYMVMTLFTFMLLLLWSKMHSSLGDALKYALSIFAFSLPVVAILFMVFPRISFDKKDYGFKDEFVKRSGHNGKMSLGSDAQLVPSKKIVMEVFFKEKFEKSTSLYFRGTTLYQDNTDSFTQMPTQDREKLSINESSLYLGGKTSYDITLYPHNEKWLYTLDLGLYIPVGANYYQDYTLLYKEKIDETYRYKGISYLKYKLNIPLSKTIKEYALDVDIQRDPQSSKAALSLKKESDKETLQNLVSFFSNQNLTYTLKPGKLDATTPIDSFLFGSKKGYCVHFSSAFTYMARSAGLPARVVTGYLMNSSDTYEKYLVVRESAAHAWVEVYLKDEGWIRVESTRYASNNENLQNLEESNPSALANFIKQSNLKLMYLKYIIENWILEYSHFKQLNILDRLLNNTKFLFTFLLYLVLFSSLAIITALFFARTLQKKEEYNYLSPLIKDAKKHKIVMLKSQSIQDFLRELEVFYDINKIQKINNLYHKVRYSKEASKEDIIILKREVNEVRETYQKR